MHDLATTFLIFAARYLFVAPIVILAAFFLVQPWPAKKRMARFAMPALALTYVAGVVGNHLYVDPRPFVVGHFTSLVPHAPDNGFPSDHTLLVSALAVIACYWNQTLGGLLVVIALLVAIARVYVGLHHPIDVIGSMAIATIMTSAVSIALAYGRKDLI